MRGCIIFRMELEVNHFYPMELYGQCPVRATPHVRFSTLPEAVGRSGGTDKGVLLAQVLARLYATA